MSWLPLSETRPCRVCGVWRCNQCGWERRPANRLRPDLQYCVKCQTRDGQFVDVRHRDRGIAADHDEDADRLLGEVAFGYVYAPDSPERDAWLAAHKMTGEQMTDADTEYYNDKDRWVLVVEFTARDADDWGEDDAPYPHRLARVVMKDWEHDDEASTLERGVGFDGDLRWEVTDDTCFTAYTDLIDSLRDVIITALMNTVPLKLTLERRE